VREEAAAYKTSSRVATGVPGRSLVDNVPLLNWVELADNGLVARSPARHPSRSGG
jgi:hypothetical protein